jgi:hypothetical protein
MIEDAIIMAKELVNEGFEFSGETWATPEDSKVWRFFKTETRTILLEDLGQRKYRFILEV